MSVMDKSDAATLSTIEALLIHDSVSVRDALVAAYRLGRLDGQLEMARVAEREVLKVAMDLTKERAA